MTAHPIVAAQGRYPRLDLEADQVHVWCVDHDEVASSACLPLLSAAERLEAASRTHQQGRRQFIIARALVRAALSHYDDRLPVDWRFGQNRWGRPQIDGPDGGLRFSLSHTKGLTTFAVARDAGVGVDVEQLSPQPSALEIAQHLFAPALQKILGELAEPLRSLRFLQHWTLAEAYLKARGTGFEGPADTFWFDVASPSSPRARFEPPSSDDPSGWQFHQTILDERHVLALACASRRPVTVRITRYVPPLRFARWAEPKDSAP
jgi:4'-phosphopantetheinyl transferase